MHGAPLFSALAAEAAGADLIYVALPRCHAETAKAHSLNFQVHPFRGDELTDADVQPLLELLATVDAAVVGPGLARDDGTQKAMRRLIAGAACPLVLDAGALQTWTLQAVRGKTAVLTPHRGELERMGLSPEDAALHAVGGTTIHLKGPIDRVISDGRGRDVPGGNAGLTVGGTGDALAGLIAGLLAQGMVPADACVTASTAIKRAGGKLFATHGYAYTTQDIIGALPGVLRNR